MGAWTSDRGGAGRRQSKSLGRDHWARARAPSPRPFPPHSVTPPDRAAAARGHFCHTPSVQRWSGASAQRGGRSVVRPVGPASRKHPSLTVGIGARERRWKGPKPGGGACSRCSSVDSVAATANKPRGLIRRRESAELANLPRTDREPHGMDFLMAGAIIFTASFFVPPTSAFGSLVVGCLGVGFMARGIYERRSSW